MIHKRSKVPKLLETKVDDLRGAFRHLEQAIGTQNVHTIVLKSVSKYEPGILSDQLAIEGSKLSVRDSKKTGGVTRGFLTKGHRILLLQEWAAIQARNSRSPSALSVQCGDTYFIAIGKLTTTSEGCAQSFTMEATVGKVEESYVYFSLAGVLGPLGSLVFRATFAWFKTAARKNQQAKLQFLSAADLATKSSLRSQLERVFKASSLLFSSSASLAHPVMSGSDILVGSSQQTATSSEGGAPTVVDRFATFDIPAPNMEDLQSYWSAVDKFDLQCLGTYQLDSMEKPLYYLRRKYGAFLNKVLTLIVSLSPKSNAPENFSQERFDLSLKLLSVFSAVVFQNLSESELKNRAKLFENFEWEEALRDVVNVLEGESAESKSARRRGGVHPVDEVDEFGDINGTPAFQRQARKAERHIRNGEIKKAKESLTNPVSFASASQSTFIKLESKHPKRLEVNNFEEFLPEHFQPRPEDRVVVTAEMVWNVIQGAVRGASPGIDGLRFDHLYYLSEGGTAQFLRPLVEFLQLAVDGLLPSWFMLFLAEANLVALAKGDTDIRPVAMGSVWRKLMGKCALLYYLVDIIKFFELYQYGVGSSAGCETVILRTEMLLKANPRWIVAKSDFKNAFNSMFRKQILEALRNSFPGLYNLVLALYGTSSKLWAFFEQGKRRSMMSEEGVQQGDVLGPFLFCLVVQPILMAMNDFLKRNGGGEVLGLLDDFTIVCLPDALCGVWNILDVRAKEVGLSLSLPKCEVYAPNGFEGIDHLVPAGVVCKQHGISLLGGVIGDPEFCEAHWTVYLEDIEREADIICKWNNVQAGLCLFRFCVVSRLNYMLRSMSPHAPYADRISSAATALMKRSTGNLMGGENDLPCLAESDTWWLQSTLPPKMGGMGIVDASSIQSIAYLAAEASAASSFTALNKARDLPGHIPSVTAQAIYANHLGQCNLENRPSLDQLFADKPLHLQRALSVDLHVVRSNFLRSQGPAIAHRLDSCSGEAAALVTTIPKCQYTTIRDADQMRERLSLRLGLDVGYLVAGPCKCGSGQSSDGYVDSKGYHLQSQCLLGGRRLSTHNAVRDPVIDFSRAACYTCKADNGAIMRAACRSSTKSRADMLIDNFDCGKPLGVDVSVIDVRSVAYSKLVSPVTAGKAAADREVSKIKKYRLHYQSQNALFEAFALETNGRFGPRTRDLFRKIAERVHSFQPQFPLAMVMRYWRQRIVMALHIKASANVRSAWMEVLRRRAGIREGGVGLMASSSNCKAESSWSEDMVTFDRARF